MKRWEVYRAPALAALAARLAELTTSGDALNLAQSITKHTERADVLAAISPHLSAAELSLALDMAGVIGDNALRGRAMSRLVPQLLRFGDMDKAREAAGAAVEPEDRVAGALAIVGQLPPKERRPILKEAWELTGAIADPQTRIYALAQIAPGRPDKVLAEAISLVGRESRQWGNLWLMKPFDTLLAALSNAGYTEATLDAIRAINFGESLSKRIEAFDEHPEMFPPDMSKWFAFDRQELEQYKRLNALCKAQLLGQLLAYLPEDLRNDVALEVLGHIDEEWDGLVSISDLGDAEDMVLAAIVRNLPFDLTLRAGKLVAKREKHRGVPLHETRVALALREKEPQRDTALQRALDAMLSVSQPSELPDKRDSQMQVQVSENLVTVWTGGFDFAPIVALPRIIPHLPKHEVDRLLERADGAPQATGHGTEWMWPVRGSMAEETILCALAIRLAGLDDPAQALDIAHRLQQPDRRRQAFEGIVVALEALDRSTLADIWMGRPGGSPLRQRSRLTRNDLLADVAALIPVISTLGGRDAATGSFKAIRDAGHWWP